jgi:hypothetical protein
MDQAYQETDQRPSQCANSRIHSKDNEHEWSQNFDAIERGLTIGDSKIIFTDDCSTQSWPSESSGPTVEAEAMPVCRWMGMVIRHAISLPLRQSPDLVFRQHAHPTQLSSPLGILPIQRFQVTSEPEVGPKHMWSRFEVLVVSNLSLIFGKGIMFHPTTLAPFRGIWLRPQSDFPGSLSSDRYVPQPHSALFWKPVENREGHVKEHRTSDMSCTFGQNQRPRAWGWINELMTRSCLFSDLSVTHPYNSGEVTRIEKESLIIVF